MEYQEIIDKIKPELEKSTQYFANELLKIRTSRPSVGLIEDIEADIFGKRMPLKSLGQIFVGQGREAIVQPWDASYLEPIQKAISQSSLQASCILEKDKIRIKFPALNQESRKNLVKILSEKTESAKKTIRHWRTQAWKEIQDTFAKGEITQDNKFRAKDKLQELIDEHNKKVEEMKEKKEKEILE